MPAVQALLACLGEALVVPVGGRWKGTPFAHHPRDGMSDKQVVPLLGTPVKGCGCICSIASIGEGGGAQNKHPPCAPKGLPPGPQGLHRLTFLFLVAFGRKPRPHRVEVAPLLWGNQNKNVYILNVI
ncbi:unnamed protein product [Meganyctiphanes norvegica]|uniref:Secreted protein n=1 Tax=Meganyctiphanes norvegica TaxID=48144 RepID=A0AAV2Q8V8_MEGNR